MAGYRYPDNYPDILSGWPNMGRGSLHHRDMVIAIAEGLGGKIRNPDTNPDKLSGFHENR
jgi:hypothetical protein